MTEWNQGALARQNDYPGPGGLLFKTERGWVDAEGDRRPVFTDKAVAESAHPLAVIDPEDREAVARLYDLYASAPTDVGLRGREFLAHALREFANPKPPKPDEPQGLGAVVEDANGGRWIRIDEHMDCNDWVDLGAHSHKPADENETVRHFYRNIDAVKVLSPGVTE